MPLNFNPQGLIARMLASAGIGVEGQPSDARGPRMGKYNEMYVINRLLKKYPHIDGGEYRVASMAPGATALQLGLSASFSATAAALLLQNSDVAGGKRCYLDYIRFLVTTPPTSATSLIAATVLDQINRTPTNVALLASPATQTCYKPPVVDPNLDNGSPNIIGVPYFPLSTSAGAPPVIPAAGQGARTIVGNLPLRSQIAVISDEIYLDFGAIDGPAGALVTAAPAGASKVIAAHPGVVIGPGGWFILYIWGPSNATAGIAFGGLDMGWWEA